MGAAAAPAEGTNLATPNPINPNAAAAPTDAPAMIPTLDDDDPVEIGTGTTVVVFPAQLLPLVYVFCE